ncbi:MAG: DUF2194 domain-containing protein, partial [Anaerolineae bacterium]
VEGLPRIHSPGRRPSARDWLLRVLQVTLFIPLLLVAYRVMIQPSGSPQELVFASASQQRILVIHNSTDVYGDKVFANALQALDYARLNHEELDLASAGMWPDLDQYSSLLLVTEMLNSIDETQAQQIADYVAAGGGLAVVYRAWNPHLATLFGMEGGAKYPELIEGEGGLRFQADLFPGVKGLDLSEKTVPGLSPFNVALQRDVKVLARSGTGRPIVWLYRHGQGRVIYWNAAFLTVKEARGFIVQSVMNVQGVGVLPIANFATLQIDDFPASISTEKIEPVKTEYDMTLVDFYDKVWFPDMMDIARRYGLTYTFLLPFNYNALVEPPFTFREWEHADVEVDNQRVFYSVYVSHLAAQGHELGLHGYNHISLTLENWPSEEDMVAALQAAWDRWDADNLGPHTVTYVPPNNIYDAAGARALTEGFPSLRILAGIYTGHFESGGNREFGPEPWNPQLFDIPRLTFGYNMTQRYRYVMMSELGMMGIWTHFMHPDDVVHTPANYPHAEHLRNPNYWPWRGDYTGQKNGFYYRFLRWLDFARTTYPWLRYVRTSDSLDILRLHLQNKVTVDLKPQGVVLHSTTPTYFQVRVNDGRRIFLNTLAGAQLVHVYQGEGYTLYTLRGVKQEVHLQMLMPIGSGGVAPGPARPGDQPAPDLLGPEVEEEDTGPADLQNEDLWQKVAVPTETPEPTSAVPLAPLPSPAFPVSPTSTPVQGGGS